MRPKRVDASFKELKPSKEMQDGARAGLIREEAVLQ